MTQNQNQMLVQLSTSDFLQLVKEAVKTELSKITDVIKLSQRETENESELLTKKQTESLLNVSSTTLYLWSRDKVLEHKKIGRRIYYLRSDVMNKLNSVA